MKSVGFKQMHPMQIEALMDFVGLDLHNAAPWGEEAVKETQDAADELVRLFGGNGVEVRITDQIH